MCNISAWLLPMMNWLTQAMACDRIFGFEWRKNVRNLGMRTLRGRLRLSESRISAESSQIFCNAPKAPSHMVSGREGLKRKLVVLATNLQLSLSSMAHREGRSSCQLISSPREAMVVISMPTWVERVRSEIKIKDQRLRSEIEIGGWDHILRSVGKIYEFDWESGLPWLWSKGKDLQLLKGTLPWWKRRPLWGTCWSGPSRCF